MFSSYDVSQMRLNGDNIHLFLIAGMSTTPLKIYSKRKSSVQIKWAKQQINQRTNGPVNAHLISEPNISTQFFFAKSDIVVK